MMVSIFFLSKFFSKKYSALTPYTPGEQPKDMQYIKLNTNESPFPPSASVTTAVSEESSRLQLYSDPENLRLRKKIAELYSVSPDEVIVTNGSDEVLNFAFMAFSDEERPLVFPDITYGFYPVFAELNGIPYTEIPLKDDFSIDINDYMANNSTVVIANPNAPTGLCLSLDEIEKIVAANPDNVVIIDEAYIDFGGESAITLTDRYDNLLVTRTFSKSYSLAGARLGFGIGASSLIADLNTIKYSTNPYNVNRMTMAAGVAALKDNGYYMNNCKTIIENREWTSKELKKLGFTVTDSMTNFIFAKSDKIGGKELYLALRENGVLIRHFDNPIITDYNRITVGTRAQMETLLETVKTILEKGNN